MKRVRSLFSLSILALVLLLAACGTTTNPGNTYSAPTSSASTPTASAAASVINTASVTVAGKSVTALVNAKGWTLYYFTPDTATTSNCTGACATTWPPVTSSGAPTSMGDLPSGLNVQTNGNGSQVTYNGHNLYTYVKDTAAGQTNGEGVGGKWHVATTDLGIIAGAIGTAPVTINGKSVTALVNAKGWTLYYFTPDTATASSCTGTCAKTWPPVTSKEMPASTTSLTGMFGLQTNGNGSQVTYNGHNLYTYVKDTAAGQTNGEGVGGKWHVATTDLPALGGSTAAPTPTTAPSTGGYNY